MTNSEFKEDCQKKLIDVRKSLNGDEQLSIHDHNSLKEQEELLTTAIKIMTYGTGPERRRFRRDYERRLK